MHALCNYKRTSCVQEQNAHDVQGVKKQRENDDKENAVNN